MDPITLALAIAAMGKLFKGVTGYMGAMAESKSLRAAGQQARHEAASEANIGMEEAARVSAAGATRAAASGGGVTGSAVDVLADLGRQSAFNARSQIYRGMTINRARLRDASVAKTQGRIDLISSVFDAASTFAGGTGEARQRARIDAAGAPAPAAHLHGGG